MLWGSLLGKVLIDRLAFRSSNSKELWFLLVEIAKLMVKAIHKVDGVIIIEDMVEIDGVVRQGEVAHSLLRRLPKLIVDLIVTPFKARLSLRLLMLSLQVLFSFFIE